MQALSYIRVFSMKKWVTLTAFFLLFAVLFLFLQAVFMPKWTEGLAATSVIDGFYAEDPDSLDIVFFGTSHQVCGISPMELYEKTGIKSAVLATGNQPMQSTYYWIREAHKTQKKMVAVVDLWSLLFQDQVTDEVVRQSIDDMHFSLNKMEAIGTLAKTYGMDPLDLVFPLLRYHSRMKELSAEDFAYLTEDHHQLWKGHYPIAGCANMPYQGLSQESIDEVEEILPVKEENAEYLLKTADYCKKEEIPLVFIKLPVATWTPEQHRTLAAYAEKTGVDFLDMNVNPYYDTIRLDPSTDYQGEDHLDMMGAVKVTDAIGEYLLSEEYVTPGKETGIVTVSDERWENDIPKHEHAYRTLHLPLETDIDKMYADTAGDSDYIVFLGYHDAGIPEYTKAYEEAVSIFGIQPYEIESRKAKLAIIEYEGKQYLHEITDEETLSVSGLLQKGQEPFGKGLTTDLSYDFWLQSAEKDIRIDGKECTTTGAVGLHVIVYGMEEGETVCEVCFIPAGEEDVYWQIRDLP